MTGRAPCGPWATRAALTTMLLAASCGRTSVARLPDAPPTAGVRMDEYRFEHGSIPAGRVVFRVTNVGIKRHRLALIPIPDDFPPILEQLRGSTRRAVEQQAAIPDLVPGGENVFAVDVSPGRYAMVCFVVDDDGTSHARRGMASEFIAE